MVIFDSLYLGFSCFIKNIWHFKTVCWRQRIFFFYIWFIFTFCSYRISSFLNVTSILADKKKIWPVIGKMLSMLTLLWVKFRPWNEAACLPSGTLQTKGGYNKEENYRFSQGAAWFLVSVLKRTTMEYLSLHSTGDAPSPSTQPSSMEIKNWAQAGSTCGQAL